MSKVIVTMDYDINIINKIIELKGDVPQHWVAHSWGGVLLLALLAKNPAIVAYNIRIIG